jgi:hypothetical protein
MKNIALEKLRTGSCDVCNAASRYLFNRNFEVVGPPKGSVSLNPADALAPIITIRDHGAFPAPLEADDLLAFVAFCEFAAPTEPTRQLKTIQNRRTKNRDVLFITAFCLRLLPDSLLKTDADSMLFIRD